MSTQSKPAPGRAQGPARRETKTLPKGAPLQLLLFRHPGDQDSQAYEEALARAVQGGKDAGGRLATGEDLGLQWELFAAALLLDVASTGPFSASTASSDGSG
jgi:hypothetical protein